MKETKNTTASIEAKQITTEQLVARLTLKTYSENTGSMEDPDDLLINAYTGKGLPGVIGHAIYEKDGKVAIGLYYWDSKNEDGDPYEYDTREIQADMAATYINALPNILPTKWGLECEPTCKCIREPEAGHTTTDEEIEATTDKLSEILLAMEEATEANEALREAEQKLRNKAWEAGKKAEELANLLK